MQAASASPTSPAGNNARPALAEASAEAGASDDEERKDGAVPAVPAGGAAAAAPASSGRSGLSIEDDAKSESGEEDRDASLGVDPITDEFDNWTYSQLSHFVRTYEKENDTSIEGEDQKAESRTGQKRNRKDLFDCALHIFSVDADALPTYLTNNAASAASSPPNPQQRRSSATPSKRNRTPSLSALAAAASAPSNQSSTSPSSTTKKKRAKTMTVSATKKGSSSTSSFLADTLQLKIVGEPQGEPLQIVFDHDRISWERAGLQWSWVINKNWLALGNTVQQLINKMLRTDMSLPVVDWITMERVAEKASSLSESIAAAPFEYDIISGILTAVDGNPFQMQKDTIANARKQLIVAETSCRTTC